MISFADKLIAAWPQDFDASAVARWVGESERLIFMGNGGSAAIASHMATDFAKNAKIPCMCFNDASHITMAANDYGYEEVFACILQQHIRTSDCVVAISSSGRSRNILAAAMVARDHKARLLTLTGFDHTNPLSKLGQRNFHVPSHDYGVVETLHLAMLHAVISEFANAR